MQLEPSDEHSVQEQGNQGKSQTGNKMGKTMIFMPTYVFDTLQIALIRSWLFSWTIVFPWHIAPFQAISNI